MVALTDKFGHIYGMGNATSLGQVGNLGKSETGVSFDWLGPLAAQFIGGATGGTALASTSQFVAQQAALEAEQTKRRATTVAIVAGAAVLLGVTIFLLTRKK